MARFPWIVCASTLGGANLDFDSARPTRARYVLEILKLSENIVETIYEKIVFSPSKTFSAVFEPIFELNIFFLSIQYYIPFSAGVCLVAARDANAEPTAAGTHARPQTDRGARTTTRLPSARNQSSYISGTAYGTVQ